MTVLVRALLPECAAAATVTLILSPALAVPVCASLSVAVLLPGRVETLAMVSPVMPGAERVKCEVAAPLRKVSGELALVRVVSSSPRVRVSVAPCRLARFGQWLNASVVAA